MEFELISNYLENEGLHCPSLEILKQDHNLYNSLFYQPKGEVEATDEHIGNTDKQRANNKIVDFFELAINKGVELAATPEYSCPWDTISSLIDESILPSENNLWVIGCESIEARELNEFVEEYDDIAWLYEEDLVDGNLDSDNFLDPVCYLFKTRTAEGQIKNLGLIQFKTHTMGGIELERDNMITGNTTYVLRNEQESSRLFTLICSDSLSLNEGVNLYDGFRNNPHIIIHLQLNQKPNHPSIRPYRGHIYGMNLDDKEVICLNWSRDTLMNGEHFNDYGGTAYYIQSDDVKLEDKRLNSNYKLGLYYTYWDERYTNIYYLNYDEHVFYIRSTKPSQIESPVVNRNRTGPEMLGSYVWKDGGWKSIDIVDSGFKSLCESIENADQDIEFDLLKSDQIGSTDIERLIALSTGNAKEENWYSVKKNQFFKVNDEEKISRITFPQNPNENIKQNRRAYLHKYAYLKNTIIKNGENFPDNLQDLKDNCIIKYRPNTFEDHYGYNIYPKDVESSAPASGIFIGQTDQSVARKLLDKMREAIKDDHSGKRIIIWFKDVNGNLQRSHSDSKPKTTDNPQKSSRAITKSGS